MSDLDTALITRLLIVVLSVVPLSRSVAQTASPSAATSTSTSPVAMADCLEEPGVRELFKVRELSPEEVTTVAVKYAKQLLPDATIEYVKPLEVLCRHRDGNDYRWSLENLHAECNREPAARPEAFRRYAAFLVPEKSPPKYSTDNIYPMIRGKAYVEHLAKESDGKSHMVNRPFLDDLRVVYAFDTQERFQLATADKLKDVGVNESALHNAALRNLHALAPRIIVERIDDVWAVSVGGNFESSLILDDAVVRGLAARVQGDLLVSIPSRDTLLFTGSREKNGLAALVHLTQVEFERGHHPISTRLFRRVRSTWTILRR